METSSSERWSRVLQPYLSKMTLQMMLANQKHWCSRVVYVGSCLWTASASMTRSKRGRGDAGAICRIVRAKGTCNKFWAPPNLSAAWYTFVVLDCIEACKDVTDFNERPSNKGTNSDVDAGGPGK